MTNIQNRSRGKALITEDFNARHKKWDKSTNQRGVRLEKWAKKHRWRMQFSLQPTCTTPRGTSKPDRTECQYYREYMAITQ